MDDFHKYVGLTYEALSAISILLAVFEAVFPNVKWLGVASTKVSAAVLDVKKLLGIDREE